MQALDRTAPTLPIMPTTPARMTHDYVRHGTTNLFAALDVASGSMIAEHYARHRHQEFLRFLRTIDTAVPAEFDLHLIGDNYATHKTPAVKKWLLRHLRFHMHFTPTSASWLNLVERWFRRADQPQSAPLDPPQRHRTQGRCPSLDQRLERRPETVRLDQIRRRHPRNTRRILPTHY